ncbi:unnamed protein product [Trichogramma brassicae]|uniref:Uncharacterized protein n=1 Tax=Trichogramma brassicae TaxID=86971 RepID=A0A6H5IN42_9HYME|nr:unnamed protein product [Trichogramma brassicae]
MRRWDFFSTCCAQQKIIRIILIKKYLAKCGIGAQIAGDCRVGAWLRLIVQRIDRLGVDRAVIMADQSENDRDRQASICLAFAVLSLALDRSTASSSSEPIGNHDDETGSSSGSPDSRLERVYVKQETGFDGKVHSIRFSLDPVEADERLNERQPRLSTVDATFGRQSNGPARLTDISEKQINAFGDVSLSTASEPKSKRSLDQQAPTVSGNDFRDLDVAESKVFRPLFVYRQQVARRLKARNDRRDRASKRSSRNQLQPQQTPQSQRRARPSIYNYYYPNSRLDSGVLAKLVSNAVVHALEALIAAILSPVLIWRWLAKHEHFMLILRVTLEVIDLRIFNYITIQLCLELFTFTGTAGTVRTRDFRRSVDLHYRDFGVRAQVLRQRYGGGRKRIGAGENQRF